ncbi:MAG TPA: MFS transporter [Caulobacteraceae bacterium]|nr:MFS transporter [Caulobacteraceae bacterium]
MTSVAAKGAYAAAPPLYSEAYKGVVLAMLVGAYTFNFIDRTIVAVIGQAIKVDLKITDTQLGLLGGFSFAVLYTVLGIPIARAAERFSRVNIIAVSMVLWSGFTVACGLAPAFGPLLATRVGVGVGEAGCSPPAHSLISDYYAPRRRASALAVYSFGIPLGAMIGAVAGGVLATLYGWRVAFMVVGAPGVIMALIIKLVVREPPRGHSELVEHPRLAADLSPQAAEAGARGWLESELAELGVVARRLFGNWPVANMMIGVTLASFAGYGAGAFGAPYFNRAFGLSYAAVGLIFGVIGGLSTGAGTLAGGFFADRAARRAGRWYALTPAVGLAIATPIAISVYEASTWQAAALIALLPGIFSYTYLGPTFGVAQNMVEPRRRATATALMFFVLNFIALGGGPVFTGWIIDALARIDLASPGHAAPAALAALIAGHGAVPSFALSCPGGLAPAGAGATAETACHGALVAATRQGIEITLLFYAWAAMHYLLGSIGLARRLALPERGKARS